jgi:SAM-dependent methyltransferase
MERGAGVYLEEEITMDWEAAYQVGETPWDKGTAAPELTFILRRGLLDGRVLVPGCGLGHDARAIAMHGASEVVGLDIAPSAVAAARKIGGPETLVIQQGDLFDLPAELRGHFDWVWEHTCFCAIDPSLREKYVESVAGALPLGGHLVAVFYLNPRDDGDGGGPPFGVTREELDSHFGARFQLVEEWPPQATYSGREGREWCRLLRRIV